MAMNAGRNRPLPRPFTMPWGSGLIVEEASSSGEYHEPTIQLLEYTEGPTRGSLSVRFCYYRPDGRFQRGPLMLNEDDVAGLRDALAQTPRLRTILRRLVEE
jgi:hypothetical protein